MSLVGAVIINCYLWILRKDKPFIIQTGRIWDDIKAIGAGVLMTGFDIALAISGLLLMIEHGWLG